MKHFALAFLIATLGCKKANDAGGAGSSGSSGSAIAGSATGSAGSATGSAAGSATGSATGSGSATVTAFDDKLTMPKMPKRDKDEQARIDGAAAALQTALTQAKTAKDSAELCKAFEPLNKAMTNLQKISAPKGVDQQQFSSERDALLQLFDGASNWCDTPANVGLDTLQDIMSKVRQRFVDLVGRGA